MVDFLPGCRYTVLWPTLLRTGQELASPEIEELNIGHSIIARAVCVGLETAIREMIAIMRESES